MALIPASAFSGWEKTGHAIQHKRARIRLVNTKEGVRMQETVNDAGSY
jgi:hypothetical protein